MSGPIIPVSDAHCHASPKGLGAQEIATRFKKVGGWFIALVSLPPHYYGFDLSVEGMLKSIDAHVKGCEAARAAGIKVACIAGIHPAVIDRLVKVLGSARADEVVSKVCEVLKYLRELRCKGIIDGFGEFGRPHYRTLPESVVANEVILTKVFEIAEEVGGVIHLHLEQGGTLTTYSVYTMLRNYSIDPKKVVLHHSTVRMVLGASKYGYSVTFTGKREAIKAYSKACREATCMVESDYIDDPSRPGVVMYPWEISEEVSKVLESRDVDEELLHKVLVDNVAKVYGVKPP